MAFALGVMGTLYVILLLVAYWEYYRVHLSHQEEGAAPVSVQGVFDFDKEAETPVELPIVKRCQCGVCNVY